MRGLGKLPKYGGLPYDVPKRPSAPDISGIGHGPSPEHQRQIAALRRQPISSMIPEGYGTGSAKQRIFANAVRNDKIQSIQDLYPYENTPWKNPAGLVMNPPQNMGWR